MTTPHRRPAEWFTVSAYLADLSTAGSAFTVAPCRGYIKTARSVIENAITVADATWTLEINGTAVTGVSVTVANSGSAAGDVDEGIPTSLSTSLVNEGDAIEFVNAAGSTTTCPVRFHAVIEPV